MIEEVQIIQSSGIPVFHYSVKPGDDDIKFLQASFFTAISSFASEMQEGDLKVIALENKSYLLKKVQGVVIIFGCKAEEDLKEVLQHQKDLNMAGAYLSNRMEHYHIDFSDISTEKFDQPMQEFDEYLVSNGLITKHDNMNVRDVRQQIRSAIFKSVGYEPGKCNIGREERFKRLSFGLVFLTLSMVLYSLFINFNLPKYVYLVLVIPNFLGFLGLLQYFYRFCTTNAMQETYSMN